MKSLKGRITKKVMRRGEEKAKKKSCEEKLKKKIPAEWIAQSGLQICIGRSEIQQGTGASFKGS